MDNLKFKDVKTITSERNFAESDETIYINRQISIQLSFDDMQAICKLCLFEYGNINIDQLNYDEKYLYNTYLCDSLNDCLKDLPKKICDKCLNKIKMFVEFKIAAIEVEKLLTTFTRGHKEGHVKTEPPKISPETSEIGNTEQVEIEYDDYNILSDTNAAENGETEETNIVKHSQIEKNYQCEICDIHQQSKKSLKNHYLVHHGIEVENSESELNYQCEKCGDCFKSKQNLNKHYSLIHTDLSSSRNEENENTELNKTEATYKCKICGKCYSYPGSLRRHSHFHTGLPHKCKTCGKGFIEPKVLKDHMNTHDGIYPYKCEICETKVYRSSRSLRKHKFDCHSGNKKEKQSIGYNSMKKHVQIPVKIKKALLFPSDIRVKLNNKKRSETKPTNDESVKCKDCDKIFANNYILAGHRKIHKSSYKCKYCGKTYSSWKILCNHMKSHTIIQPYSCMLCSKRYSSKCKLNEHMRYHTGEKLFPCQFCNKTFVARYKLSSHLKICKIKS